MKFQTPHTLESIAKIINAKTVGDLKHVVTGINEIHMVESGDLCFVDHPKYYDKCLNSAATTILINQDVTCPAGKALLISDDPFRDYKILVQHFLPFQAAKAMISPDAKIGEATIVQPGVFIGNNVVIGKNCLIQANATILDHCVLGDEVIIGAGAVLGGDAFYYKKRTSGYDKMSSCGRVIISDRVEVGALCTIDRGVTGDTFLGEGCKLDNQVHIGHDTVLGKHVLIAAQTGIAGVTKLEDDVILWGQVGVNKDLVIGKGAVVYAQSGVGKSIPPGQVFFGSPAEPSKEKMREIFLLKGLSDDLRKLRTRIEELESAANIKA